MSANTWYHVAFVRNASGVCTVFLNGTRSSTGTATITTDYLTVKSLGYVSPAVPRYFQGYLSNCRLTNTAVYDPTQTTITVPTTPLTAISGTSLLTLQSNYFKDNSSNNFTLTATGTPSIQAFSPFAPTAAYSTATVGGSGYFNGTTDYLSAPANAAFGFGTGDFTLEFWLYYTGGNGYVFFIINNSGSGGYVGYGLNTGTKTPWIWNNVNVLIGNTDITLNTWQHHAVVRSSGTVTIYLNGISIGSTAWTANLGTLNPLYVAHNATGGQLTTGYMSNVRVVKGTAVYTSNFTPPTAPLTAVTNTSILLSGTNAGIYDATAKNNLTTVSNAQVSTAQSQFGGSSMLFNGTTDYLTTIDKPIAQLGTGDFTIEGWVYLSAVGTARGLVSKGAAATGWSVGISAANVLTFAYTASTLTAATALSVSTWYYFAVVRSGTATGNVKIYLNGSVDATSGGAITDNFNQTSTGYVGADRVGTSLLSGYLDEVRVTSVARTITTPTAAFPTS
jgi:hypothetical protein